MGLSYLIQGECNVCVDAEHLPQRVLVRLTVHVPVKDVFHHVEEGRVVILRVDFVCKSKKGIRSD